MVWTRLRPTLLRRPYTTHHTPTGSPKVDRLRFYRNALKAISERTGAPLPSLITSFAVLHEITALIPLMGIFLGAKYLGIGEQVVEMVRGPPGRTDTATSSEARYSGGVGGEEKGWLSETLRTYVDEGEKWAGRVGRRYGWWGYEKGAPADATRKTEFEEHLAGDVANAVVAYAVVKAILPLRIGLSLYLSPAFSRALVEPTRKFLLRALPSRRK